MAKACLPMAMKKYITPTKIFYHPDRLNDWQLGGKILPVCIDLHLTNACNNRCIYCGATTKDGQCMDTCIFDQTIKYINSISARSVVLTGGGEPTLSQFFTAAISTLTKQGRDVGVITNAVKMSLTQIEEIVKLCRWVRVSIDAGDAQTYQKIRGNNKFDDVITNIQSIIDYRDNLKTDITIGAQIVVNKHNYQNLSQHCKKILKKVNVDYIQVRPIESTIDRLPYNNNQIKAIKNEIKKLTTIKKIIISDKFDMILNDSVEYGFDTCNAAHFVNVIDPYGDVYLCCHMIGNQRYKYGNVFKSNKNKCLTKLKDSLGFNPGLCPVPCRGTAVNIALHGFKTKDHKNFL